MKMGFVSIMHSFIQFPDAIYMACTMHICQCILNLRQLNGKVACNCLCVHVHMVKNRSLQNKLSFYLS